MSGIQASLPVTRRYRAWEMVIRVVGQEGVGSLRCGDWGQGGTVSSNTQGPHFVF